MVEYVSTEGVWGLGSPTWGISAMKALWSLYSVRKVVVVVGRGTSVDIRISPLSSGELFGTKVGVSGYPKCVRDVLVIRSVRGL